MSARETAERHANDVVAGKLTGLMGDFAGTAMADLVASGGMPPNPTTKWEILSETALGEQVQFHVRYSNDTEALELQTTWQQLGDTWRIVKAAKVG